MLLNLNKKKQQIFFFKFKHPNNKFYSVNFDCLNLKSNFALERKLLTTYLNSKES